MSNGVKNFIPKDQNDDDVQIYQPKFKNLSISSDNDESLNDDVNNTSKSQKSSVENSSSPPSRLSNVPPRMTHCDDPDCQLCQLATAKSVQNLTVVSGEVDNAAYDPELHVVTKSGVERPKHKPFFAKKLAQLDAAMKLIAGKVDQCIWDEKYLDAEELQSVLVWLRKVDAKLRKLLEKRSECVNNKNFKAAQTAKDEYETAVVNAVDMSKIQKHLSPTEYSALLSLQRL